MQDGKVEDDMQEEEEEVKSDLTEADGKKGNVLIISLTFNFVTCEKNCISLS